MKQVGIWLGVTAIIFGSIFGLIKLSEQSSSSPVLAETTANVPAVEKTDMTYGNPPAGGPKVILVEYSDFQCPACGSYSPLVNELMANYKDKILYVYRNFPLPQHKNAMIAAQAAYAAGLGGKFWQMQEKIFSTQKEWSESNSAEETFTGFAKDLGLDMEKFKADLNSEETIKIIQRQLEGGQNIGVNSTPTFFLNNKKLQNPKSYSEFKQLVEEKLKI